MLRKRGLGCGEGLLLTARFSLQMDGEGLLNDELPNCWECPKCYQGDDAEKGQVRRRAVLWEGRTCVLHPTASC